jgi:hypothetical protein
MTVKAAHDGFRKVFAAFSAGRGWLEFTIRQRAVISACDRAPPYGESDGNRNQKDNSEQDKNGSLYDSAGSSRGHKNSFEYGFERLRAFTPIF